MSKNTLEAWAAPPHPGRRSIAGTYVSLVPLDPDAHEADLFQAAHGPDADPHLWDYMGNGPFTRKTFGDYLRWCVSGDDPLFFAVEVDGRAQGVMSYLRITPEHGVIEIGHIWFGPALQRTRAATEATFLISDNAFALGYRRLEWKCDALNERSRRAALRYGFTFEGIFRKHMIIKNRNRDTAWFAIVDDDWSSLATAYQQWLSPDNFDMNGDQVTSLRRLIDER